MNIKAIPLSQESYQSYGDVISVRDDLSPTRANLGTAQRYNFLANLKNLRPNSAEANLCVFHCNPMLKSPQKTFEVKRLEKHFLSTQAFVPMSGAGRFLVVVCLGLEKPDPSTLRAFVASGPQGMTYHPGVWHHPLIAMDQVSDFACLVWEDGSEDDCTVVNYEKGFVVEIP